MRTLSDGRVVVTELPEELMNELAYFFGTECGPDDVADALQECMEQILFGSRDPLEERTTSAMYMPWVLMNMLRKVGSLRPRPAQHEVPPELLRRAKFPPETPK